MSEKGGISVQTEHIFPIIKRWLYSEKDIFLRELISNAADAVSKLKHLISIGEVSGIDDDFSIFVKINKKDETLTISDNGIGMSEEEVKKYINQIALSGALDFIQKYDGKNKDGETSKDDSADGIIGHFGLGFYSAFMVADKVDIITKSYSPSPAVFWTCNDEGDYEMENSDKSDRGTDIILHINEDNREYLEETKLREIAEKYCSFMPTPIYIIDNEKDEKIEDCRINPTEPLWTKNPSQCSEEEYDEFYQKVFHDYKKPLFHIHINADYPLNFKGILYFPKISNEYQSLEGEIKLFYNRVFVSDNIKEIIPDYLLMMKGVLDCPELPLNVSRSYLQTNSYVAKLSAHIVKKVCDKINSLYNTERERYESIYEDLKIFLEYGCLKDEKFYDRVKNSLLFKSVDGNYLTIQEYLKDKNDKNIYYTNDIIQQSVYIDMFKKENIDVVIFDKMIDNQFISFLEQKNNDIKFVRVDASTDAVKNDGEKIINEKLQDLFRNISGKENLEVSLVSLKDDKIPAVLNVSEESRRFNDMLKMYGMYNNTDLSANSIPDEYTLSLNKENSLIKKLEEDCQGEISEKSKKIAKQIFSLSVLSQRQFSANELSEFLENSYSILENL